MPELPGFIRYDHELGGISSLLGRDPEEKIFFRSCLLQKKSSVMQRMISPLPGKERFISMEP